MASGLFWLDRPTLGQLSGRNAQYRGYTPRPSPRAVEVFYDARGGGSSGGGGGSAGAEGAPEAISDLEAILQNIEEGTIDDLPSGSRDRIGSALEFIQRAKAATGESQLSYDAQEAINEEAERDVPLWAKALEIIDIPRAVVVSGAKELADALPGEGVVNVQGEHDPSDDPSLDQFFQQVGDHYGGGDLLRDLDLQIGERGPRVPGTSATLGEFGDRLSGFALDVAADPLTYIAPEAKLLNLGGRGTSTVFRNAARQAAEEGIDVAARSISRQIADEGLRSVAERTIRELGPEGLEDAARRARQRGISALTDDELAVLGTRGGLYFNVPGTGRIARGARNTARRVTNRGRVALGREALERFSYNPIQAQLLRRSDALTAPLRGVGAARAAVNRTGARRALRTVMGGRLGGIKNVALATDDASTFVQADEILAGERRFNLQRKLYEEELEAQGRLLETRARKARVKGKTIQSALGGNVDAIAAIEKRAPGLFDEIRAFDEATRTRANVMAGEDFIPHRADHAYAIRPKELRDYYRSIKRNPGRTRARSAFDVEGFEQRANIIEGGEFMGERLVASADHPRHLNPREQAQEIIEDRLASFGHKAFSMFEEDWYKVYPQQVRTMARRAAGRGLENFGRSRGIFKDLYRPTKKTLREVARYERMRNQLDFLNAEVRRKTAGVSGLGDRVAAATRRADRAAKKVREVEGRGVAAVKAARERTGQPSKRAAVQREFAATLEEQHTDVGAQLYALEQRELRALTESDLGTARAAADEAFERVRATNGRVRQLRMLRDEAKAKLARAQAFPDAVEADAKEIVQLQREIDELDGHIDALQEQIAQSGRRPEAIRADLDAVKGKLTEYSEKARRLERTLSTLRLTTDSSAARLQAERDEILEILKQNGLTVDDVQRQYTNALRQIETGGRFTQSLKAELSAAEGRWASDEVRMAVDELAFNQELRAELAARAEQLGDSELVARLAAIEQHTLGWDERGMLLPSINGGGVGWYHGTSGMFDLTPGFRVGENTTDLDAFLGLHFTTDQGFADQFSLEFGQRRRIEVYLEELNAKVNRGEITVDEGNVMAQDFITKVDEESFTGQFDLHIENPKVYEAANNGHIRPDLTGGMDGTARSDLTLDMLGTAIERGLVTAEDLAEASAVFTETQLIGRFAIDATSREEFYDEALEVWERIIDDYMVTGDIVEAIGRTAAFTDLDMGRVTRAEYQNASGMHNPLEVMTPSEVEEELRLAGMTWADVDPDDYVVETTARAVSYGAGVGLSRDMKRSMEQAFRDALAAEGYDGAVYRLYDGGFAAIAVQPEQIRFRGVVSGDEAKVERLVDTWHQRREAYVAETRRRNDPKVRKHERAVAELGEAAVEANGSARQAYHLYRQNKARLEQIQQRVAAEWDSISAERSRLLFEEADLRARVNEQYELAARLETEDMANNLEAMFAAVDDYERQSAKAAAEAAEAQAMSLRLSAAYDAAQADLAAAGKKALTVEEALVRFTDEFEPKYKRVLEDGFAQLSLRSQGPDWAVDALKEVTRLYPQNGGLRALVRAFDYATNIFKTYAVLTPGFNFRNFGGGVFSNWIAGMEQGGYRTYARARHLYDRGGRDAVAREMGDQIANAFDTIERSGLLTGGQTSELTPFLGGSTHDRGIRGLVAGGGNFGLRSNIVTKANVKAMGHVENALRGSLALDTMLKGGTLDDAIDRVFRYHFDYDDLSSFEASVLRRVFPFYTWMRKNFVLQVEMMLTHPHKYNRILRAKANLESGQDQEPIVPGYFREQLAMMTPWEMDGGRVYATLDLPYQDLNMATNPREILSAVNPWFKVPAELATGRQFFSNIPFSGEYSEAPASWASVPFLMEGLSLLGRARRGADGTWHMRDYDAYMVEQFFPLWGRARRLVPSEERYQQRLTTSWLSTIFGLSLRTNTPKEIEGQIRRQEEDIRRLYEDLVSLGYVLRPSDLQELETLRNEEIMGTELHGVWGPQDDGTYGGGPEGSEMEQLRQAIEGGAMSVSELYDENPDAAEALYG
jgi:uncharacterized coiled-coil DUF342 family protein